MKRNIRDYKAFKKALDSPGKTHDEHTDLQVNYTTTKSAAKKYKAMLRDFDKNEKQRNLGLSEEQILLRGMDDSDDAWSYEQTSIVRDDNTLEVIDLHDFYYTSKQPTGESIFAGEENALTPGQTKQIEVELRLHLGISNGWIPPESHNNTDDDDANDDEFEYYAGRKHVATVIIPPDFKELIPLQKSERRNEYPLIIKRLGRNSKLSTLASACKSHPKSVEQTLEKCFIELKNALKAK